MNIYIVGCGDIGKRVAALWQQRAAQVFALARTAQRAAAFDKLGIKPLGGDLDQAAALPALPSHALVYYFAPPVTHGSTDPRMQHFLDSIPRNALPARIVYISTSGVYGDVRGAWVTEESPTHPSTDRSRRRLDAEQALQHWSNACKVPMVVLRVPGIYGPGRLPIEVVKSGRPILRESESMYTNRIHADDLANICVAAGELHNPPGIYNVSDGHSGTMAQYFKAVADLLGIPHPPEVGFEEAQRVLSPEMMSYLSESRRVDNSKMLRELKIKLRYPTLADGIKSCGE